MLSVGNTIEAGGGGKWIYLDVSRRIKCFPVFLPLDLDWHVPGGDGAGDLQTNKIISDCHRRLLPDCGRPLSSLHQK